MPLERQRASIWWREKAQIASDSAAKKESHRRQLAAGDGDGYENGKCKMGREVIKASRSTWNYEVEKLIQRQDENFELSIKWKAKSAK